MAFVFRGFVRTKLYPIPAPEKLIPAEGEDGSAENPNQQPGNEFGEEVFLIFCGDSYKKISFS